MWGYSILQMVGEISGANTRVYGISFYLTTHLLERAQRVTLVERRQTMSWISIGCGLREIEDHATCVLCNIHTPNLGYHKDGPQ